jgi:hypothetical protein
LRGVTALDVPFLTGTNGRISQSRMILWDKSPRRRGFFRSEPPFVRKDPVLAAGRIQPSEILLSVKDVDCVAMGEP